MESKNGTSNAQIAAFYNPMMPLPPYPFTSDGFPPLQLNNDPELSEGHLSFHQRCSSESFLFDEEPEWLDDLLDESDATFPYRCHRRSTSDSYAYLGESAEKLRIGEGYVGQANAMAMNNSSAEIKNQGISAGVDQNKDENSSKTSEDSADKSSGSSQVKPYASKAEGKRAKQHNAHRSRARKLQYIVHLEKTVDMLKTEGSEVSAELQFVEQQNMILTMENRALRQRLDSVSQEQAIKQWEQGMLEREIGRLQTLFHVQKHQQFHHHHHQQQQQYGGPHGQHYYKHRRNRSKGGFEHQAGHGNNQIIKIEDPNSGQALAAASSVWA